MDTSAATMAIQACYMQRTIFSTLRVAAYKHRYDPAANNIEHKCGRPEST